MEIAHLFQQIVGNPEIHARFLNSLSFMENAGARKISACEHPTMVGIIQLKHAAEEHRHAYYLKKQILKLKVDLCPTYEFPYLLGGVATKNYLQKLDIQTSRFIKKTFDLHGAALQYAAYLFVTYAIEVRADALYPVYQDILTKNQQKVHVKSIILEEEGHLEEMIQQLQEFNSDWKKYADHILAMEEQLFHQWIAALARDYNKCQQAEKLLK